MMTTLKTNKSDYKEGPLKEHLRMIEFVNFNLSILLIAIYGYVLQYNNNHDNLGTYQVILEFRHPKKPLMYVTFWGDQKMSKKGTFNVFYENSFKDRVFIHREPIGDVSLGNIHQVIDKIEKFLN